MSSCLRVMVDKLYTGLTPRELAKELAILEDDYIINWEVEKDYEEECDGFKRFNGLYNLRVSTHPFITTPDKLSKTAEECYAKLLEHI